MTRFGEIFLLLQNFRMSLAIFVFLLVFGKSFSLLWNILDAVGQFFIVANSQISLKLIYMATKTRHFCVRLSGFMNMIKFS